MGAITHNGEVLQRLPADASQINFDKTGTDLNATQTENAIKEVNTKVNTLQSEKADTDMVASDFSTAVSYTAGNYCIYEGKFYKFKNDHSGAWSAADVDEIKIAGELSALKSGLTDLSDIVNRQNQTLDLTNVTEPSTNVKRYTFAGVDLLNKVLAIFVKIADYGYIDSRIVVPVSGYNCKYVMDITDENSYRWGAAVNVYHNHIDVTTLPSSYQPSDYPMLLDAVVIVNHF